MCTAPNDRGKCSAWLTVCLPFQKEFTVYVDRNGTVEDLLHEAFKEVSYPLYCLWTGLGNEQTFHSYS